MTNSRLMARHIMSWFIHWERMGTSGPRWYATWKKLSVPRPRCGGRRSSTQYTFLFHFANDGKSSDGMEHLTSTQIIMPGSLADKRHSGGDY
mgnify:CR=1 FL=1